MLSMGFDRPNISFDVVTIGGRGAVARKWDHLMEVLGGGEAVPAIVYCGTRKETAEIAAELSARGIRAAAYHARLSANERGAAQDAFMTGGVEVILRPTRSAWAWTKPTCAPSCTGRCHGRSRGTTRRPAGRAVTVARPEPCCWP